MRDDLIIRCTNVISDYICLFYNSFLISFSIRFGSSINDDALNGSISDLLHINRQLTVLAFQYGDAISNILFPTSAILMGALAVGKISYTEWLKFVWKPILIWIIICSVAMSIALVIGY